MDRFGGYRSKIAMAFKNDLQGVSEVYLPALRRLKMVLVGREGNDKDNAKRALLSMGLIAIGITYGIITKDMLGAGLFNSIGGILVLTQAGIGVIKNDRNYKREVASGQ